MNAPPIPLTKNGRPVTCPIPAEDKDMHRLVILTAFFVGATLVAPVSANADDHEKRYYDRDGHDYHTWNDHEDKAYRVYLGEQHRDYREFGKVKVTQQREYFKWRHEHPDNVLFKVEVK
jgi:hypothetical protein